MNILSRHSRLDDAMKALACQVDRFEEEGKAYAAEIGHEGKRLKEFAANSPYIILRMVDTLGGGDEFAIHEDGDSFMLVSIL